MDTESQYVMTVVLAHVKFKRMDGKSTIITMWNSVLSTRFEVALLAVLLYDWFITFQDELEFVWTKPFTFPQLFFVLIRYLTIASQVLQVKAGFTFNRTNSSCFRHLAAIMILSVLIFIFAESLILLRTSALYRGNARVFAVIYTLYVVSCLAGIIALSVWAVYLRVYIMKFPVHFESTACLWNDGNAVVSAGILGVLILWEIVITALAFCHAWMLSYDHCEKCGNSTGPNPRYSLRRILYETGFIFIVCNLACSTINLTLIIRDDETILNTLLLSVERVVHALTSTRILLFIRSRAESNRDHASDFDIIVADDVGVETDYKYECSDLEHVEEIGIRTQEYTISSPAVPIINMLPLESIAPMHDRIEESKEGN